MGQSTDRVLITSLGSIGRRHLNNVRQVLPGATIAALRLTPGSLPADATPDLSFASLDDAIAFRPDFAIIASPASEHRWLALELISNGIPVLVEKPFATSADGLAQLVEQAESTGVPLRIAYNLRYHPLLVRIKALLNSDAIGRVVSVRAEVGQYLPDWRPQSRYQDGVSASAALGGGALLELSHELDYIYWLFGKPDDISAAGGTLGNLELDVEDMASVLMSYSGPKRVASVHLDFLQRAASRSCKLIGTNGTLIGNLLTGRLERFDAQTGEWTEEQWPLSNSNQTYIEELKAFVTSLSGGSCDLPEGREGLDVMAMIDSARHAMIGGNPRKTLA